MIQIRFFPISVGFLLCIIAHASVNDDYYYRPYPVLMVHGFNADIRSTWNTKTWKNESNDYLMTTLIKDDGVVDKTSDPSIVKSLIQAFNKSGSLPTSSTNPNTDLTLFKDYYLNESVPPGTTPPPQQRMQPWEEAGSYSGINHTYVELYGDYYYNEGDDGYGRTNQPAVSYPSFAAQDATGYSEPARLYDLSPIQYAEGPGHLLGGQTSLVRLRIIQMLNEYYGDWKWVDDPTAKIKIVPQ
jgi:hypothetical protein